MLTSRAATEASAAIEFPPVSLQLPSKKPFTLSRPLPRLHNTRHLAVFKIAPNMCIKTVIKERLSLEKISLDKSRLQTVESARLSLSYNREAKFNQMQLMQYVQRSFKGLICEKWPELGTWLQNSGGAALPLHTVSLDWTCLLRKQYA